jgi:exopolysaccharide production protein ExoQ
VSTPLATCLFAAFILWLFYRNSDESSRVSRALWIPTLWVAVVASKPLYYWINGNPSGIDLFSFEEGSRIDRNFYLALLFIGLCILTQRADCGLLLRTNRWLWFFYAYALFSVLWSDYPFFAFKRWIRDIANVVMILIIVTDRDPVTAIRQVFLRCAYLLIPLSILFIKYYPAIGVYYNGWTGERCLGGVTTSKNTLAMLAMVSGIFLLWSIVDASRCSGWYKRIREKLPELLVFLMCVWIISAANSMTSLTCFLVGVAVFFGSRVAWIGNNRFRWYCCALSLVLISLLFFCVPDFRAAFTTRLGRNADLTERTEIWEESLRLETNPLIGTGFGSFWMTREGIDLGSRLNVSSAHSGYLENYLNGGLIGLALLLAAIAAAARNTAEHIAAGSILAYLYAALLLSSLIYNYSEATFNHGHIIGFVVWLIAIRWATPIRESLDAPTESLVGSTAIQEHFAWER